MTYLPITISLMTRKAVASFSLVSWCLRQSCWKSLSFIPDLLINVVQSWERWLWVIASLSICTLTQKYWRVWFDFIQIVYAPVIHLYGSKRLFIVPKAFGWNVSCFFFYLFFSASDTFSKRDVQKEQLFFGILRINYCRWFNISRIFQEPVQFSS